MRSVECLLSRVVRLGFLAAILAATGPDIAWPRDGQWPDPVANDVLPYHTAGLLQGPLLGAPTSQSIRIWVRTQEPGPFAVLYDTRLPLGSDSRRVEGQTLADRDSTGVVELAGLKPATRYYYAVQIGGALPDLRIDYSDPWPSFRTLPDATTCADPANNPRGLFDVCFSLACCASQDPSVRSGGQYGSPPGFDTLWRLYGQEIMFHVFNGDTIYEECRDGTREGIRANYRLYLDRGRSMSRLLRSTAGLFLYDDHEIGWDLHGCGEVGLGRGKHLIRDPGVDVWTEYCGWANYPSPFRATIRFGTCSVRKGDDVLSDSQADFSSLRPGQVSTIHVGPYTLAAPGDKSLPPYKNAGVYGLVEVLGRPALRVTPAFRADEEVPYSIGSHHFYDWKVANCHFFALDTRGDRSRFNRSDIRDPASFLLGPAQLRWLLDGVRRTDADFIFIISPDPWVIHHTAAHVSDAPTARDDKGDGFASFVHQREQLLAALDGLAKPVLIFSGDVHNAMSVQISDNVWEFLCGPMGSVAHPIATAGGMPFGGWFDSQGRRVKVKWTLGFPDNVHYTRLRGTCFAVVQVNNVMHMPRPEGSGYQFVAYDRPQAVVRFHDGYSGRLLYAEAVSPLDVEPAPPAAVNPVVVPR